MNLVPKYGSEPTVLYAVREHEAIGAIIAVKTDRNARGPKGESKYYDLTQRGVASLILHLDQIHKLDRSITYLTQKYRALLPDIFVLWPAIHGAGLESVAMERLTKYCKTLLELTEPWLMKGLLINGEHATLAMAAQFVADDFWDPSSVGDVSDREQWIEGLCRDDDLRKAAVSVILKGIQRELTHRNEALSRLSYPQLEVATADELERLREQVEKLRLAIRALQDFSGLKVIGEVDVKD